MKNHEAEYNGKDDGLGAPYLPAAEVRRKMNLLGGEGIPFMFGVDYQCSKGFISDRPFETENILWKVEESGNCPDRDIAAPDISMDIAGRPSYDEYAESFDVIRRGLLHGDSFLANLTTSSRVSINGSLRDLFLRCGGRYKFCIGDEFVCFSPEPFITLSEGKICTFPMKGTRPDRNPEDEFILLSDYKEICEHHTIVDLLRNDLAMVADNVRVEKFRYVERVETCRGKLLQTSSEISGRLREGYEKSLGDILFRMLPAGSICGAPKSATLNLIAKAERHSRGWYCGVAGYFDGRKLRSGVMIRCVARHDDGSLWFHSGGGITVNSRPEEEYQEAIDKIYLPLS